MKKLIIGATLLAIGCVTAMTQEGTTPVVPQSLPTAAPDFSSWTTSFTYLDKKDDVNRQAQYQAAMTKLAVDDPLLAKALAKGRGGGFVPRVKDISVVKSKDIEHQIVTYMGGQSEESWKSPSARAARNPQTQAIEYRSANVEAMNFPELKWVTGANFKQTRKVQGVECLVFQGRVARMQIENPLLVELTGSDTTPDTDVEVVVNAATLLPVSVRTDEVTRTYSFRQPPTAMQQIPQEFASVVNKAESKLRARLAPLSPP